ncbi:MAG: rhodanese-like domain-containing protein [Chloroflexota bacterium]
MGRKSARRTTPRRPSAAPGKRAPSQASIAARRPRAVRSWLLAGGAFLAISVAVVAGIGMTLGRPSSSAAPVDRQGTFVEGVGGQWLNVTPGTLASMLESKDFTLLNVKTPYIGEIAGTDLYIPYTDLQARAADLPQDRASRILVYCRSGAESAIAAQTLLDLGYTDIVNLDGGMSAWVASGRAIVQKDRS